MYSIFQRTELLLSEDVSKYLKSRKVLVVGLGGVGAYAAEMLCRAGIGNMLIIDGDTVDKTNINRQLPALHTTVGQYKTDILEQRFKDINPELKLRTLTEFIKDDRISEVLNEGFDFVVDAIDVLSHKVSLIDETLKLQIPIISVMGAGGKLDPSMIQVVDIEKSYNCKLAKMVRKRLHKRKIYGGFDVVFSPESVKGEMLRPEEDKDIKALTKTVIGTISYMPAIFGCFCAAAVVNSFINQVKIKE